MMASSKMLPPALLATSLAIASNAEHDQDNDTCLRIERHAYALANEPAAFSLQNAKRSVEETQDLSRAGKREASSFDRFPLAASP